MSDKLDTAIWGFWDWSPDLRIPSTYWACPVLRTRQGKFGKPGTQCDTVWHIDDESQLEWQAAVRPAFRKLAAKLHPDVAGTVQHDVMVQGISRVFYARVFRAHTCWLLCATSTIAGPGTGDPAAFRKVLWVTSTCLLKLVRRTFVILLLFQRPCKRCCEITQSIEFLNFRRIENSQKVMVGADGETNVVARRSGLIWLDVFLAIFFVRLCYWFQDIILVMMHFWNFSDAALCSEIHQIQRRFRRFVRRAVRGNLHGARWQCFCTVFSFESLKC